MVNDDKDHLIMSGKPAFEWNSLLAKNYPNAKFSMIPGDRIHKFPIHSALRGF